MPMVQATLRIAPAGSEASASAAASTAHVLLATFVGTAIEWYDFFLYGTAAALVFPRLFFPRFDPLVGTLLAFATFAVGFVARPLGGVVFGHFGDRVGRKTVLGLTLVIMGAATFAIGLLPTYAVAGIAAPAVLVALRLAQGFGLGGEWGGAVLMAIEHAPEGKRGYYGSWPQTGAPAGLLLSTAVFAGVSQLPEPAFLSWGWRVPFLLSIVLVVLGGVVRSRLAESPEFARERSRGAERLPVLEVLRAHKRGVVLAMGARLAENAFFYVYTTFVLAYATERVHVARSTVLAGVLLAAAVDLVTIPLFGALSDRIGRRAVYLSGAVFSALFVVPFFVLLGTGRDALVWLAIVAGVAIGHAAMYGPQASFFAELFGTRVRYSGASLGYQLASVLAGGLSPVVAAALLGWAHGAWWAVAAYMIALALVTIASVSAAPRSCTPR
jgi:metabolite-proton symporter